jgi:uncharacterized protein (DUF2147 family)
MKIIGSGALALVTLALLAATPAVAGDPTGVWIRANGNSKIRIDNCGSALCGTVVWEKNPRKDTYNPDPAKRDQAITGLRVLLGMKPSGTPDQWKGEVYNADDGKTYTGYITLEGAGKLKLQGCVLGGLICKSDTWSRS